MNAEDYSKFVEVVNRDCERRGKPAYSGGLLEEMFEDLEDVSLEQFLYAAKCHRRSDTGQYALSVANIRKQLGLKNVQDLTWQDVLVMAKQKNTPLAIIASRYVKSYDLEHQSDLENSTEAKRFLADLPQIVGRLEQGQFTQHELILCKKYDVDPRNGIHFGHAVLPDRAHMNALIERVQESHAWGLMMEEKRLQANSEPLAINHDGQKRIAQELKVLLSDVPADNGELTGKDAAEITGIEL